MANSKVLIDIGGDTLLDADQVIAIGPVTIDPDQPRESQHGFSIMVQNCHIEFWVIAEGEGDKQLIASNMRNALIEAIWPDRVVYAAKALEDVDPATTPPAAARAALET